MALSRSFHLCYGVDRPMSVYSAIAPSGKSLLLHRNDDVAALNQTTAATFAQTP